MPEANVLYAVTSAVVLGLVVWVAVVLITVKEPWARAIVGPPDEAKPGAAKADEAKPDDAKPETPS